MRTGDDFAKSWNGGDQSSVIVALEEKVARLSEEVNSLRMDVNVLLSGGVVVKEYG
jgi:hypothetical protein